MGGVLLILIGILGGLFAKDRLDLALKGAIIALIILALVIWSKQHP